MLQRETAKCEKERGEAEECERIISAFADNCRGKREGEERERGREKKTKK